MAVVDKFLVDRCQNFCTRTRSLIALNYLSPHDSAETDTGKEFGSPWITVETAIAEAIEQIMENLNHLRMNSDSGQSHITERKLSRANQ